MLTDHTNAMHMPKAECNCIWLYTNLTSLQRSSFEVWSVHLHQVCWYLDRWYEGLETSSNLSECSKGIHKRSQSVLRHSPKSNSWLPRSMVYGPGAHKPWLNKFTKIHQGRNELVLKGSSETSMFPDCWYENLELKCCLWGGKGNHRRNVLALKCSSTWNVWALRVHIHGHGDLSSVHVDVAREMD